MKAFLFIFTAICVLPNLQVNAVAKPRQLHIVSDSLIEKSVIEKVEGSKVEVRCYANKDVPIRDIYWTAQQSKSRFEQHHLNNYTVVFSITDLHRSDAGVYRCILDHGSDHTVKQMRLHVLPKTLHPDSRGKCGITQFRCVASDVCIFTRFRCDGQPNCPDLSDELNCPRDFCRDKFRCNNSRCIDKRLVCDGSDDCSDGTDEDLCSTISTVSPNVEETYHFNWLKTTVYTVIGCTVAIVIFISFIVIVVFRIKMKRLRARRLARAMERHRQHQDGSNPGRSSEQDPFLTIGTNSHFGNIIVNVNNGVQYVPSGDFTPFVDSPPSYNEVVGAQRQDSPPPPYSTIDRSPRPKSVTETTTEANPASGRRDLHARPVTEVTTITETANSSAPLVQGSDSLQNSAANNTTQSLPPTDTNQGQSEQVQANQGQSELVLSGRGQLEMVRTNQGQSELVQGGSDETRPVQSSQSLPRPGRLAVHDGKIVINPENTGVAGPTEGSSQTLDMPRQGQLEVKEGQIVLKVDGEGDEALTRQLRGVQSPLEEEGSQSRGGGTLDVQDGVIVFRPRES